MLSSVKTSLEDAILCTSKSTGSDQWDTIDTNNSLLPKLSNASNKKMGRSNHNTSQSNNEIKGDSTYYYTEEDTAKYAFKDAGYLKRSLLPSFVR